MRRSVCELVVSCCALHLVLLLQHRLTDNTFILLVKGVTGTIGLFNLLKVHKDIGIQLIAFYVRELF